MGHAPGFFPKIASKRSNWPTAYSGKERSWTVVAAGTAWRGCRVPRQAVTACLRPQRPCEASETCVKLRPFSPVVELLDAFVKLRDVVGYILLTTNASEEGRWLGLNLLALPICGQLTAGDRRECGQGPHSQMGTSTGVKIIRPFPAFLPCTPVLKFPWHQRQRLPALNACVPSWARR